jgi:NAD(P)-dependent dehydrogenase (short-subunit alcohol dehydrogenase family)
VHSSSDPTNHHHRATGSWPAQVNNAGITQLGGWSPDTHASILRTNLDGALDLTLALLPQLAQGARVVMVSSGARGSREGGAAPHRAATAEDTGARFGAGAASCFPCLRLAARPAHKGGHRGT